jgi:hypothetical protein
LAFLVRTKQDLLPIGDEMTCVLTSAAQLNQQMAFFEVVFSVQHTSIRPIPMRLKVDQGCFTNGTCIGRGQIRPFPA